MNRVNRFPSATCLEPRIFSASGETLTSNRATEPQIKYPYFWHSLWGVSLPTGHSSCSDNGSYQEITQSVLKIIAEFHGSNVWNPEEKMDEDCLYINVWIPNPDNTSTKKAIMVRSLLFIPGVFRSLGPWSSHLIVGLQRV